MMMMVMMVMMVVMMVVMMMVVMVLMVNVFLHELYYGPDLVWFQQSDMIIIMIHDDVGDADNADGRSGAHEKGA
jgi:hypothetical protein